MPNPAIQRVWFDWGRPCLPQAAEWLVLDWQRRAAGGEGSASSLPGHCDGSRAVCVLPGRRAGRMLLGLLLEECGRQGLSLSPPRILTPGAMVDALLPSKARRASAMESRLAWMTVLREAPPEAVEPLAPATPSRDDAEAWLHLAGTIARLHEDLAGAGRSFADARAAVEHMELAGEREQQRWQTPTELHATYLERLRAIGLCDPHEARREALAQETVSSEIHQVVLIGVAELNAVQRQAVQRCGDRAVALVHAPESMADRFDELGCVDSARWTEARLDIEDERIIIAERPDDQAQAALRAIAGFEGRFSAAEITIGLGDEQLGPTMAQAADWAGLAVRSPAVQAMAQTAPLRLLGAIADWLSDQRFERFANLLRHPDLESHLRSPLRRNGADASDAIHDWLTLLDRSFNDHLMDRLSEGWLGVGPRAAQLKQVYDAVNRLLQPLAASRRALGGWSEPILQVLTSIYGNRPTRRGSPPQLATINACLALRDALAELSAAPHQLQPSVDAPSAIRIASDMISQQPVAADLGDDEIEVLGWLELHLDPAPALVLMGVNDGAIPSSATADPFLPDSLRSRLGLVNNAQRLARDAYALSAILASRAAVTLIAGRRDAAGDPLPPSRLLLACDEALLPARVLRLCDEKQARAWSLPQGLPPPTADSAFTVPDLRDLQPPEAMRVTWFREYLQCPYRFALRRLVGIQSLDDAAVELDPARFGTLAHQVLCAFGSEAALAECCDPQRLERRLIELLHQVAADHYGPAPRAAIRVQVARLEQRLRAFASAEAAHRAEGWAIRHCELELEEGAVLDVPGQADMPLRGKVDRVDFNSRTGEWMILDYKTSDAGHGPLRKHHGSERIGEEWLDLQLPLYRHLARTLGIEGTVRLGYVLLPKHPPERAFALAEWSDDQLAAAIDKAREVVREIRAGTFAPNGDYHGDFDEFARICQTMAFRDESENEEAAE